MNTEVLSRIGVPTHFTGSLIALLFFCINANCQTNIYFETGSDHVDAKGKVVLQKMAANLAGKEIAFMVRGYADTTGIAQQNFVLARKREAAVAAILTENGIDIQRIGYSCDGNIANVALSDAENRRVSVTAHELSAYTAKNGSVIMASRDVKLRLIDQFYQPDLVLNYYRNKSCLLPLRPGKWLTDVAIESATDSCNFIIVKNPDREEDYLPVLFLGKVKYEDHGKISFRNYATQERYKLFRVPLYSNYIALDQYVWCGFTPTVYLEIVLPKTVRPVGSKLADSCIALAATFRKDTLRAEFHEYARVNWKSLTLAIKTRDTMYQIPMSAFEIISERVYGAGLYVLKLPEDREGIYFPKKQVAVKKRRTFWQRLFDLFR
jgi:hypothetical protein